MGKGNSGRGGGASRAELIREGAEQAYNNLLDQAEDTGSTRYIDEGDVRREIINPINTLARMRQATDEDIAMREHAKALIGDTSGMEARWEREERRYWESLSRGASDTTQTVSDDDWDLPF